MSAQPRSAPTAPPPADTAPRERLLLAATRLFCRYGINATGIDLVVSEAGTAKTTLYKMFGSKERLVEAVLEREGAAWREWFFEALGGPETPPRRHMERIFPVLKDWFGRAEFFGCPFINAIGEHDKAEDRLRALTLAHKHIVLDGIADLAARAGCQDPHGLAHQIGFLMDGAIVAAMVTRNIAVADAAGVAADALIAGALPPGPARRRTPRAGVLAPVVGPRGVKPPTGGPARLGQARPALGPGPRPGSGRCRGRRGSARATTDAATAADPRAGCRSRDTSTARP